MSKILFWKRSNKDIDKKITVIVIKFWKSRPGSNCHKVVTPHFVSLQNWSQTTGYSLMPYLHLLTNTFGKGIFPFLLFPAMSIYEVHSISFLTFFVQAFKIGIDSWQFSMLLLYILWDDWPIFMISGLNATAGIGIHPTKAWLSQLVNFKMQSGHKDTLEKRYAIKFYFELEKKCHRNVWNASDCFWSILQWSSLSFWGA